MVRWRMDELMERYEQVTGKPLGAADLLRGTSLSTSTAYLVVSNQPKRIGLQSVDALLTFFSGYLGDLTTADLIEFELGDQVES